MANTMVPATLPWNNGTETSYEDQFTELASAIVYQAVKDYMKTMQALWKKDQTLKKKRNLVIEKMELEEFFYSDWYGFLTDLDPDRLLDGCRKRALEQEKERIRRQNLNEIKRMQTGEKDGIHDH